MVLVLSSVDVHWYIPKFSKHHDLDGIFPLLGFLLIFTYLIFSISTKAEDLKIVKKVIYHANL